MAREDLIASAVAFLQDPSVASSSIDSRKAFLQSKNLTQEEIEIALVRANEDPSIHNGVAPGQISYGYTGQQNIRPPPPPAYGYDYRPYQGGPWPQQPLKPPQRDWRDWFIMATVTGGVSYGLYTIAKRYVMPLISPPTPPQLEQDKAAIDESFSRAFALIDQLATDTAALKAAETSRTEKLDTALLEVEAVIADLKTANNRREEESRRIAEDVRGLKDMIPKALDGWKADGDSRLKDLGAELRSLKTLLGNRVGTQTATTPLSGRSGGYSLADKTGGSGSTTPRDSSTFGQSQTLNGSPESKENSSSSGPSGSSMSASTLPKRDRAAIPAWQMAAKNKAPAVTNGEGSADGSDAATES